jgi:hypothetical protein
MTVTAEYRCVRVGQGHARLAGSRAGCPSAEPPNTPGYKRSPPTVACLGGRRLPPRVLSRRPPTTLEFSALDTLDGRRRTPIGALV